MAKKKKNNIGIDNVTTTNLDAALKMYGISLDIDTVDTIIDIVELLEKRGDNLSIKDLISLKQERRQSIISQMIW